MQCVTENVNDENFLNMNSPSTLLVFLQSHMERCLWKERNIKCAEFDDNVTMKYIFHFFPLFLIKLKFHSSK